jgi:ribosome-binding protein aMBF1 (putative translation factor)
MNHARWKLARERAVGGDLGEPPEVAAARAEIRLAFDLGQAVHDRRTELGISQTELAGRAGMTQPQVSKLELGGTVPTLPLLARLAKALDASLNIALDGDTSTVVFTPHAA